MVIAQGEVWWADLAEPIGSAPGYRRPVIVLQSDPLNRSQIATVVCVVLTSNLRWSIAPGNVLLAAKHTGLDRDSVANVSQLITIDKRQLTERAGKVPRKQMESVFSGIDLIMGR
jgi:mRNA interferase MazF